MIGSPLSALEAAVCLIQGAIFVVCLCRLRWLEPGVTNASVAVYFIAVGLGSMFGALALLASMRWPALRPLGALLPALGVLAALLTSTWRWTNGAPDGVRKSWQRAPPRPVSMGDLNHVRGGKR